MAKDPKEQLAQEQLAQLIRASASDNQAEAYAAKDKFLALAETPLQDGVFDGPVVFDKIFKKIPTNGDYSPKFPLHFVQPGTEDDYIAYVVPKCGMIPYRTVAGDDLLVPTYRIGNSIDACKHFMTNARYDVVESMLQVFNHGITARLNLDAQHALAAAAVGRNLTTVVNTAASNGVFSFGLVSNMMNEMKRQGGGNSTSMNGFRLTDMLISPEAMGDLRSVSIEQLTVNRGEVVQSEGVIYNMFGVNLHELLELGVGAHLQDYIVNTLSEALPGGRSEFVIGLDLTERSKRNFVMPVPQELKIKDDPTLDRMGRWGYYGDLWVGFGVLDARGIILGAA